MSLRDTAKLDLSEIMNDEGTGGVPCTITSPVGVSVDFKALHSDIHMAIDPGTGEVVTGRQAHVSVLSSELRLSGFGGIRAIHESDAKPWLVTVSNSDGIEAVFKVIETVPSGSMGLVTLRLGAYEPLED